MQSQSQILLVTSCGMLGYFRKVEIDSDNELVIVSGIKQAQMLRSRSGLETIGQQRKSLDKGRTAIAERTVQTVRAQPRTLVNHVEHHTGAKFPDSHPLEYTCGLCYTVRGL